MPELHPINNYFMKCTYCICNCLNCDSSTGIRDILLHVVAFNDF